MRSRPRPTRSGSATPTGSPRLSTSSSSSRSGPRTRPHGKRSRPARWSSPSGPMSEAHTDGRRRGFLRRRPWRPGRAWLSVPVTAYLLAGLIVPIILIALYSVHLLTNLIFPPAKFDLDTWKSFLPYLHDRSEE